MKCLSFLFFTFPKHWTVVIRRPLYELRLLFSFKFFIRFITNFIKTKRLLNFSFVDFMQFLNRILTRTKCIKSPSIIYIDNMHCKISSVISFYIMWGNFSLPFVVHNKKYILSANNCENPNIALLKTFINTRMPAKHIIIKVVIAIVTIQWK